MKKSNVIKVNLVFFLVLIIYSTLGMFLLNYYQYQINPDGISHVSIAKEYLRGDFCSAINGYWGPLISWLLIPFLFLGLTPLFAVKLLSLIIGLLAIIGVRSLSYRFEMTEQIRGIILFSLIPIFLYFSLSVITADLLLTCIIIYYLNIIFRADYSDRVYKGVLCGALGAIGYLSKSYAFPFFISHFLLFNVFHYLRSRTKEKKKKILRNLLFGLAMFFILSGSWIYMISNKYKEITIGTSGRYNYAIMNPGSRGTLVVYKGLLKPPNEHAISAWEDPSYIKVKSLNLVQSNGSLFKFRLKLIFRNIYKTIRVYESFSLFSFMIIISYILLCFLPLGKKALQSDALYPLTTMMLFSSGYILLIVHQRYLWIIFIMLILMGGYLLNKLFHNDFFNNVRKKIVIMLFVLSFIAMPVKNLYKGINKGKDVYTLSKILKSQYNIRGNIASNKNWIKTLYISYYLNTKFYSSPKKNINGKDFFSVWNNNNINYYFVWDDSNDELELLSRYKEITGCQVSGLRIYSLKEEG